MRKCRDPQRGFTLLETLVALLVLGLLMVGLSQGVRTSLDVWQAQNRRLGSTADLDALQRLLRAVLGKLPLSLDGPRLSGSKEPGFVGEADRVNFLSELPTGLGTQRRAEVSLFLRGDQLVLSWVPYRHERPVTPAPAPVQTVLLQGVEKLELAYWGAPLPADAAALPRLSALPASWQSEWVQPVPPGLIRVRLVLGRSDRRRWPDLIVAPKP